MNNIKKILITISYDGSSYAGWQSQDNGPSIQTEIETKLSILLRHPVKLHGSGRTDSGVHAIAQTAHFETSEDLDLNNLLYRLNCILPSNIRVLHIKEVSIDFHARFSVKKKTYQYLIYNAPYLDPFLVNKAWHVPYKLDLDLVKSALELLKGTHDFKAFAAKNTQGPASVDSVRTLEEFSLKTDGNLLIFELTSKGFLYKMVRNLIGCVIGIASRKLPIDVIPQAFQTLDRSIIGQTAPAVGLYLKSVEYP